MVMLKTLVLFVAVALVKAEFELSPTAKQCIQDVGIDIDTVKGYVTSADVVIPEDNKLAEQFFSCTFDRFISDTNELIVDDKIKGFTVKIYKYRLGETTDQDVALNEDLPACASLKGDSKGLTAIKVTNCIKEKIAGRVIYLKN